jgi:hypothetical protein
MRRTLPGGGTKPGRRPPPRRTPDNPTLLSKIDGDHAAETMPHALNLDFRFLALDRAGQFTASFDAVLTSTGIRGCDSRHAQVP